MRHSIRGFVLLALVALSASACTPTSRYVTLTYWQDPATVYVAYAENEAVGTYAKVQRCTVNEDNTVVCAAQEEVNALLNPKE
jgi:hypothetical protein